MDFLSKFAIDFLAIDTTVRAIIFGGIFLLSLGTSLWVFYDTQTREGDPRVWRGLVAVATAITLPALVLSAFNLDLSRQGIVNPLSYVALGGGAVALASAAAYFVVSRRRVEAEDAVYMPAPVQPPVEEPTYVESRKPEPTRIARVEELKHMAFLVEKSGPQAGKIHRLSDRTLVGRGDCDLIIDDDEVSRPHASIRLQDGRFFVRDLDSANGTWLLNGDNVTRIETAHPLAERDRIRVGSTVLVFTRVDDQAEKREGGEYESS